MAPEKLDRVREILEHALRLPQAERHEAVARACRGNPDLLRDIIGLLAVYDEHGHASSPPQSPISSPTTFSPDTAPVPAPDSKVGVPAAPTTWGGFLLLEELGRGGFGVVYRAWDSALKRDVALKIIDVTRLRGISVEAVLLEGQMMARVRHPNVITVFSSQQIGSEVGLAMEYIRGRTLAALVAEDGPLSADEATLVGLALCDALAAVHRLGLVHRDLKASNVMRQHGGHIILMDFGAGREMGTAQDGRRQILGTPVYMPPEMLLGSRGTPQSDVYSLGVLLYNLVTGEYPVGGRGIDQLRLAHLADDRFPLSERRPELPLPFVKSVERALAPDPASRPSSAVAFKRVLTDAMPHVSSRSARRRRDGRKDPLATPTPVVLPLPSGPTTTVQNAVSWQPVVLGGLTLFALLSAFGFLTSMAYNATLVRTGRYAEESLWTYPLLGVRTVVPSVLIILFAIIVFNVAAAILRLVRHAVPRLDGATARGQARAAGWIARTGLAQPGPLSQLLTSVGAVALAATVWAHFDLLHAVITPVNEAPVSTLVLLSEGNEGQQMRYVLALDAILAVLGAGLIYIRRSARAEGRSPWSLLAPPAAVLLAALVLLVIPWRLLNLVEFRRVLFGDRSCLVIAETVDSELLHCPSTDLNRSFDVPTSDPRLRRTPERGQLFDSYEALQARRPQ